VRPARTSPMNAPNPVPADPVPAARPPAPESGQSLQVASGVHWVRLPLPFAPGHVNTWVLDDGDGWTIVDTGLETEEAVLAWQGLFATTFSAKPVLRVVCTHMHPDHAGLAGWLTRRWGCALWMSAQEYLLCRALLMDVEREPVEDGVQFYRRAGLGERAPGVYRERFGLYRIGFSALPQSYRRVRAGEALPIGGSDWRVLMGAGHSPEHACLWDGQRGLFISGDQVLPRYWSNVAVLPIEPGADPLTDWIESLLRIRRTVPDDVMILPSHGEPFTGLHARIDALVQGHEKRLLALLRALSNPKRAADVLEALFPWPIRGDTSLGMAIGESVAHLTWLVRHGMAVGRCDDDGIEWYQATPEGSAQTSIRWAS
jgi:glyoxylase-like metal-dependent hydrolase (beta-lactamase superfamily II)